MADNYLGKKMEEFLSKPSTRPTVKVGASLVRLLTKNRSVRGYDTSFRVREDQLRSIVGVASLLPSARNAQVLRYRLVAADEMHKVLPHLHMGGALPELHLPLEGTEPNACIVACAPTCSASDVGADTYIDLGIAAQSMLLRAVEMGLNGICIRAFDADAVAHGLALPEQYRPLMVIALGRSAEHIELVGISASEEHRYYRKDGIHYVPKLRAEEWIIRVVPPQNTNTGAGPMTENAPKTHK